jgi:beta-phosphoglucomutase
MIKTVILDMDGVLIEAKDWHYEALNRALRLFGYEIGRYEHLTTYDGLPTSKKLEMLTLERGLPIGLHEFINEIKQIYTMELVHACCKPRFVHEYALSCLKEKGYKLAVASNSIRNTVEVMMQKSNLTGYLDRMFTTNDIHHPKPNPEIYLTAMRQLETEPQECLVIEDNENGIRAAVASGAHVLAVKETDEVNIENILGAIQRAETGGKV